MGCQKIRTSKSWPWDLEPRSWITRLLYSIFFSGLPGLGTDSFFCLLFFYFSLFLVQLRVFEKCWKNFKNSVLMSKIEIVRNFLKKIKIVFPRFCQKCVLESSKGMENKEEKMWNSFWEIFKKLKKNNFFCQKVEIVRNFLENI